MINSRQICNAYAPTDRIREALAMLLIGRDVRPCPRDFATASEERSPCFARVECGMSPGHDKEPSRASERAAQA